MDGSEAGREAPPAAGTEIPTEAGFEVYPGENGEHFWRLRSANGQIIATGGEGFESKAGAIRAVGTVKRVVGEQLAYEAEVRSIEDADELEQATGDGTERDADREAAEAAG